MNEDLDPFGRHAARLLRTAHGYISDVDEQLIAAFQRGLFAHAGPGDVITLLSPEQLAHTQARPLALLRQLLDPDLDQNTHEQEAMAIGQIYSFLGIKTSWLVDSHALYLERLLQRLGPWIGAPEERALMRSAVTMRVMANLNAEVRGREMLARAEQEAVARISGLLQGTMTLNDLVRQALNHLVALPDMVAGIFARPDSRGDIQCEIVVGETMERHVASLVTRNIVPTIRDDDPRGHGPSGRAWRTNQIQQALAITSDPALAPWHEYAHTLGYTSQATIPLADRAGCPRALLTLYHSWPGYFNVPRRANLLTHIRAALETVIAQGAASGHVISHAERIAYRETLSRGDLVMFYQPVIDLRSGELAKVEALARLDKHDGTYATPGDFLPAFGEHELRELFALGLRQALRDLCAWQDQGLHTSVAVNLPTQAFVDDEYLRIARDILKDSPIEPERITFELLETGEIDNHQAGANLLSQWKALGVRLAQDDLGSGYSSLVRMEQLGVDDVKIDHGLVRTAVQAPHKALRFIYHLTHLAHDIGIRVTVEGLETAGLVEAAAILGADFGQGYAIARPMSARDMGRWRHVPLAVESRHPRTALGAYAAMILRNALMILAGTRSEFLHAVLSEPSGLAHYLHAYNLEKTALGHAHARLLDCAQAGAQSEDYGAAHRAVEALLHTHIVTETTAIPAFDPHPKARARSGRARAAQMTQRNTADRANRQTRPSRRHARPS